MPRLLILGGTAEAVALAQAAAERGVDVLISLAGRTRQPARPAATLLSGGFGGEQGLIGFLTARSIDAVIDATHPFAEQISANVAAACRALGLPRLALLRPPWQAQAGDCWTEVDDLPAAAAALAALPTARRVLLTTGQRGLACFSALADRYFLLRLVEPPPQPPPLRRYTALLARGPFSLADQIRLLRHNKIDIIVAKNSGGAGARAKLDAARRLNLPLLMIRRPPPPPPPRAADVAAALAWLQRVTATGDTDKQIGNDANGN